MTHDELTKKVGLEVHSVLSRANVIAYLDMPIDTATDVARAALAIAMPAAFEMAAEVASWAHMVPPDGGSPSEAECLVAKNAAAAIRELGEKWK